MSDERIVQQTVLSLPLGPTGKVWHILPLIQNVHGESFEVVRSFQDAVEYTSSPLLREAASLAISILATSEISTIESHEYIAQQACLMTHVILTEPNVDRNTIKDTVEILRKTEFVVKQQTSSRWINGGLQLQDDVEIQLLKCDISEMLKVLHVCLIQSLKAKDDIVSATQHSMSTPSEISSETSLDTDITGGHAAHAPTGSQCLSHLPDPPKSLEVKKTLINLRRAVLDFLLGAYLLALLDLPIFYASRISTWAQNVDPLPRSCPTRNSTNSIIWMIFDDEQPDCDIEFCDRVLTTLLREWKTLRVLSSIVFASVLAMLQITRVADNAIISTPAYFSLVSGIMAAIAATMMDLYFQSGKSSPSILAWVDSLRSMSGPKRFHDDSVVLALPAVSTAWCTILFTISIVAFTLQAQNSDQELGRLTIPSLAFRIPLLIILSIGFSFLFMIFSTLRKISRGQRDLNRGCTTQELSCM